MLLLYCMHLIITVFVVSVLAFDYPITRRDESIKESIFGVEVVDAYRWLEDPNSNETKRFVEQQNNVTFPYLSSCPYRQQIKESFKQLNDYPKIGIPQKYGGKYFVKLNSGLENFAVTYVRDSLTEAEDRVLLDPNTFSSDGSASQQFSSISLDGKWYAYGISESGSDWVRIKIRDVRTGLDLNETLTKIKHTIPAWTRDGMGFFYSRFDEFGGDNTGTESELVRNQKLFYHRLNTEQSSDQLIAKLSNSRWRFNQPVVSDDGNYLYIFPVEGTDYNMWYVADISAFPTKFEFVPIIKTFVGWWYYITNDNELHYMQTNYNAPNFRVVVIDVQNPIESNWIDLIPERGDSVMQFCVPVHTDLLAVVYTRNIISELNFVRISDRISASEYNIHGSAIDLPIATITDIFGARNDPEMFLSVESFFSPGKIIHYDFNFSPPKVQMLYETRVKGFDSEQYIAKQVFYDSNNGSVKIPMFLLHHKDLELSGNNPAVLYGYGGFSINLKPIFNVRQIFVIRDLKGVFAVANLRGGSEFGENWHKSGMRFNKQNVFDDFIGAGEYLITNNYTNRDKLTIFGRSNGGLLVGAVANQRPDLFGCALAQVGVMDMLRFHKFTLGYAWISEYGNPENEHDFRYIYKYSPLHNIPNNVSHFPATLILTADHDDRVVPMHSLKYGAQLQHSLGAKLPNTPLMIRISTKSGHGRGLSTDKLIEELTDMFSFVINSLSLAYNSNLVTDDNNPNSATNLLLIYYKTVIVLLLSLLCLPVLF